MITTTTTKEELAKIIATEYGESFWKGKIQERKNAIKSLNDRLNGIFNNDAKVVTKMIPHYYREWKSSGSSFYIPIDKTIVLTGKISLITYLHEYAHSLGIDSQENAQIFATEIFKLTYPEKFNKLVATHNGGLMIAEQRLTPRPSLPSMPDLDTTEHEPDSQ